MDLQDSLRKLETEWDEFFQSVEEFFSPGFDKYNAYSSFAENFAVDATENGFTGEVQDPPEEKEESVEELFERVEKEAEEEFKKYVRRYRSSMLPYPGIEIERVAAHMLGYGVLGRCFPYSGLIQIRSDLYGDEFAEVLTHELTHLQNPHWGELEVRMATRMKLPFTPKWH